MSDRAMSDTTLRVLNAFLNEPTTPWYGLELCRAVGLKSGTIYPILARLEQQGLLESKSEPQDPSRLGRPRRRMYRLTPNGAVTARTAVEERVRALQRPATRRGAPAPRWGAA
jgi:DNA-binding PadR family transcriptional regulator